MANSKQKGNTFERKVAETLSLWLTDNKERRACWRSDSSGASATIWARKGKETRYVQANAGDLRQITEINVYPKLDKFFSSFVVECKAYADIDLYPPFNKTLTNWFDQLIEEKQTTGKKAVLIAKANNRKILYCQEPNDFTPNADKKLTIVYGTLVLDVYLFDEVVAITNNEPNSSREGAL